MAVFIDPREFTSATPIKFATAWGFDLATATAPQLSGSWSIDPKGRLVRTWRLSTAPAPR
jgi:hypothetical protein